MKLMKTKFKILTLSMLFVSIVHAAGREDGGVDGGGNVPPSVYFLSILRQQLPVLRSDARTGQRLRYLMQLSHYIEEPGQAPIVWGLSSRSEVKVTESSPTTYWLQTEHSPWSPYRPGEAAQRFQSRELIERASGKVLRQIYCRNGKDCRESPSEQVYTDRYRVGGDGDPAKLVRRQAEEIELPFGTLLTEMNYLYRDDARGSTPLTVQLWRNEALPIFPVAQAIEKRIFSGNQRGYMETRLTLQEFER